jgi:hypothetical protein
MAGNSIWKDAVDSTEQGRRVNLGNYKSNQDFLDSHFYQYNLIQINSFININPFFINNQ